MVAIITAVVVAAVTLAAVVAATYAAYRADNATGKVVEQYYLGQTGAKSTTE
ncbi:MAG: hypothetical protein IKP20_08260 [Candidatus Methanomethylophilaceae archaeon]|jgi:hypothetical protein|nr:hypothetical protein [Candidatus Methanomethylophilaceae archaeon]